MRRTVFGRNKIPVFSAFFDTTKVIAGGSANNQVKLSFATGVTQLSIGWGDGDTSIVNGEMEATHTYLSQGVYYINIKASYFLIFYSNSPDRLKIHEILNWGNNTVGAASFNGCENLKVHNTVGIPKLSTGVLGGVFQNCKSLTSVNNINQWDFFNNSTMNNFFFGCTLFNQPLNLNLQSVTNINSMFYQCTALNSNITLNTPLVTDMSSLFRQCTNFNSAVNLDTSNVKNMTGMFRQCTNFNQPLNFNTSNVTNMTGIFVLCSNFNQPLNWNVSQVTSMDSMFAFAVAFNQDISTWDVSKVLNMNYMFQSATAFNQNISSWNFNKDVILSGFMSGKSATNYSASNYDALLQKWATIFIGTGRTQTNKNIGMGTIKYSSAGKPYRDALVADGWSITDGGMI